MPKVGDHILGVGAESTWGTAVNPTARFEVTSESMKLEVERIESKALKASRRYLSSSGWAAGQKSVSGDIELELASNGMGLWFKNLLGAPATTTPAGATNARNHVFGLAQVAGTVASFSSGDTSITFTASAKPVVGQLFTGAGLDAATVITAVSGASSPYTLTISPAATGSSTATTYTAGATTLVDGQSLTVEVVRTDVAGTAHQFRYSGCVIDELELDAKVGEFVTMKLAVDGKDEAVTASGATAASYSTSVPLVFTGAAITVANASFEAKEFNCKLTSGRSKDRYVLGQSTKLKQVESEMREISGSISCEWQGTTAYNRFVNGSTASVVAKFQTAADIESGVKGYVQVTIPVARFDGETPTGGGEIVEHSLPFVGLDDGTSNPVEVEVRDLTASY